MVDVNPYAAPESRLVADGAVAPGRGDVATTGQRLGTMLLDVASTSGIGFLAGAALALTAPDALERVPPAVIGVSINLAYYFCFEWAFARTPGKWIMGTRVVSAAGGRPRFLHALGRTAARCIPFEALSFLGGRGRPVGWHDRLSRTRVVRTRRSARRDPLVVFRIPAPDTPGDVSPSTKPRAGAGGLLA